MASPFLYKAVVRMPVKSGIPKDATINDLYFSFTGGGPLASDFTALAAKIGDFYNVAPTGGVGAINAHFGDVHDTNVGACSVTTYKVPTTVGVLGVPVATGTFTLGATGTSTAPEEVAVAMSYGGGLLAVAEHGAGGTRPRASRRNRIYLGPVNTASTTIAADATTKRPFVAAAFRNDIVLSAAQRLGTALAAAGWVWHVFSPKLWNDVTVDTVWVDDAFDSQRRRGAAPTVRTTHTVP